MRIFVSTIIDYEEKATRSHLRYYLCKTHSGHLVNLIDVTFIRENLAHQLSLVGIPNSPQYHLEDMIKLCRSLKIPLKFEWRYRVWQGQISHDVSLQRKANGE